MANERRLIDSAELISMLPIVEEDKRISLIGAVADVVTMISECKPVDAVEVCRCKDCKWAEYGKDYAPYCNHWKSGLYADIKDDDFCSYGEK